MYSAEHGDATDDEVNLIEKGGNYGFPYVTGPSNEEKEKNFCQDLSVRDPLIAWTPAIAASGMTYYPGEAIPGWKNSLLLVTLKTQSLRVLQLTEDGKRVQAEKIYYSKVFGRLRDVCVSPGGDVYVSTSNRDWNPSEGFPVPADDRIIKITRRKTAIASAARPASSTTKELATAAQLLYNNYCASCHKNNGAGVLPPLKGPVIKNKTLLTQLVLIGRSGPLTVLGKQYNGQMPAFSFLKDQEVAEILTFVRSHFGNRSGPVNAREVTLIRQQHRPL